MRRFFVIVMSLMSILTACAQSTPPQGELLYCSYSSTRMSAGGKSYCELIADSGQVPRVVVCLYERCHYRDAINGEFKVKKSDVKAMQDLLDSLEVYKLNGYKYDECLDGAAPYRIYMEYSSGEKINAVWSGHDIKPEAEVAYAAIKRFFGRWRDPLDKEEY